MLKFLTADSLRQDPKTDFLKGEYSRDGVVSGFRFRKDAVEARRKLNKPS